MPGTKDPNGWENGYVQPQATYQNVGSQTPFAHDRDGKPVEVEGRGMMKIPGYEWHNKSPEFHKLAGGVKRLLENIGEKAEKIDPSFDSSEDFEQLMLWSETEKPSASLLQNPEKSAQNFAVWRKTHKSAKRVAARWASLRKKSNPEYDDSGDWTQWSPKKIQRVLSEILGASSALDSCEAKNPHTGFDLVEETAPTSWRSMSKFFQEDHLNTPISEVTALRDPFSLVNYYRKHLSKWLPSQGLPPVHPVKWVSSGGGYTAISGRCTVHVKTVRDLYQLNDLLEIDPRDYQEIKDGLETLEEELQAQLRKL